MKKALLLALAVICVSSVAYGQSGSIDIFGDAGATSCNVTASPDGIFNVYIYHTNAIGGVTASAWLMDRPMATFNNVGEVSPFPLKLGGSDVGISFSYEGCRTGSFLILTITYWGQSATAPCGLMTIVGDPNTVTGEVEFADCSPFPVRTSVPQAGQARLNPDGTCSCNVPVEETTWGGIKSLYAQ